MTKQDNTAIFANLIAAALAGEKPVDWKAQDPDIKYDGKQITLPNDPGKMGLKDAANLLLRKAKDEEQELDVREIIQAYPLDAAVAFVRAMRELYGWASPIPKMTFFGPQPPQLITVDVAPNDEPDYQVQVPWGQFTVPGIDNPINIDRWATADGPAFIAYGMVKKSQQHILRELAEHARMLLREHSIYKGKSIRLKANSDGTLDLDNAPTFLSTKAIKPEELILNPDELAQVKAGLWAPLENTALCRKHKIPLKRGALLEGPYGTGKTLTAHVTSKIANDNGWTYLLLDDVRALKDALLFAKRYAPAVIFAEDAERVAGSRDQKGNDLLNTIDGVLSKNSEVMVVLTTNHVEKIERAMLRPGRFDAVISFKAPEAMAVERLVRMYARNLLPANADLTRVGEELAGQIPATIREVTERAKLAMISRGAETLAPSDIVTSALSMKRHLELLAEPKAEVSLGDRLVADLRDVLGSGKELGTLVSEMKSTRALLTEAALHVRGSADNIAKAAKVSSDKITKALDETNEAISVVDGKAERIVDHLDA